MSGEESLGFAAQNSPKDERSPMLAHQPQKIKPNTPGTLPRGVEIVAAAPRGGASDDRRKTRLKPGLDEREPVERSSESPSMTGGPSVAEPSSPPHVGPLTHEEWLA